MRRITRQRRLRRYLTYLAIRGFLGFLRFLPLVLARGYGRMLGRLVFALVGRERRRALAHLEIAFPEKDVAERGRIARAAFSSLGAAAAEVAHIDALRGRFATLVDYDDESRRVMEGALANGRGVLVVAGHLGNWELLGFYLAWCGYPVRTLARGLSDPRLSRFVRNYRESRGVHTILRHEEGAPKAMLRAFRDGAILGFFLDQDTDVAGVFVPFFGRLAYTPAGAAAMALRTCAAVVVATMQRLPTGRFVLRIEPYALRESGDRDADVVRVTAELTARLEAAIRRSPEQWVWMHERWKRRPSLGGSGSA